MSEKLDEYIFERISIDNLKNLIQLYQDVFHLKVDLNFLHKKFDTKKFGAAFIGYIVRHKSSGELAGFYGVFPMLCQIENQSVLAAQSGDTMTHPKHQGKGLFTSLAKRTYELAKKEGIHFVFGFPNKNSYSGFIKKLDWIHYEDINNYVIKTKSLPFDKLSKRLPLFRQIHEAYIKRKLKRIQQVPLLKNSLQEQCPDKGFVIHNTDFYAYKTYYNFFQIIVGQKSCLVKIDGRLWVGDIAFCTEQEFKNTLNQLVVLAKSLGCSSVQFSLYNKSVFDSYLKAIHNVHSTVPVGAVNLSGKFNVEAFAYQAIDFDTF